MKGKLKVTLCVFFQDINPQPKQKAIQGHKLDKTCNGYGIKVQMMRRKFPLCSSLVRTDPSRSVELLWWDSGAKIPLVSLLVAEAIGVEAAGRVVLTGLCTDLWHGLSAPAGWGKLILTCSVCRLLLALCVSTFMMFTFNEMLNLEKVKIFSNGIQWKFYEQPISYLL